jgi:hypothetical protein
MNDFLPTIARDGKKCLFNELPATRNAYNSLLASRILSVLWAWTAQVSSRTNGTTAFEEFGCSFEIARFFIDLKKNYETCSIVSSSSPQEQSLGETFPRSGLPVIVAIPRENQLAGE